VVKEVSVVDEYVQHFLSYPITPWSLLHWFL
jgi:hypothetical protein